MNNHCILKFVPRDYYRFLYANSSLFFSCFSTYGHIIAIATLIVLLYIKESSRRKWYSKRRGGGREREYTSCGDVLRRVILNIFNNHTFPLSSPGLVSQSLPGCPLLESADSSYRHDHCNNFAIIPSGSLFNSAFRKKFIFHTQFYRLRD